MSLIVPAVVFQSFYELNFAGPAVLYCWSNCNYKQLDRGMLYCIEAVGCRKDPYIHCGGCPEQ